MKRKKKKIEAKKKKKKQKNYEVMRIKQKKGVFKRER